MAVIGAVVAAVAAFAAAVVWLPSLLSLLHAVAFVPVAFVAIGIVFAMGYTAVSCFCCCSCSCCRCHVTVGAVQCCCDCC